MSRAMWRSVSVSSTSSSHASARRNEKRGELVDRHAADEHRARLRPQARALARRARHERHVLLDLLAHALGVGLAVAALEVGDDALEPRRVRPPAPVAVAVGDVDALAVGAVQEQVLVLGGQLVPRRLGIDAVLLGDRLGDLLVVVRGGVGPRRDRALAQRQRRVGDDHHRVDLHLRPQAGAALARAVRRVEREDPRLELRDDRPVVGAGELLGVQRQRAGRRPRGTVSTSTIPSASATAVSIESARRLRTSRAHDQPVDDDRDVVLELLVEHDLVLEHRAARRRPWRAGSPRPAGSGRPCRTRPCARARPARAP